MNLTEKYRPTSFEDFIGSPIAVQILKALVEKQSLPPCLLFTGPKGVGKTSMARILSSALNEGNTVGCLELDAASNSGVDHVRSLQEIVRYSHSGEWRVVTIDEAHGLSTAAFNALLKMLEDPPTKTVFILVTTNPESILPTVRSRAMSFNFSPMSTKEILSRLIPIIRSEGITLSDSLVALRIAEVSQGSLRNAIILLQQVASMDGATVDTVNFLSGKVANTKPLIYAMMSGSLSKVEEELQALFYITADSWQILENFAEEIKTFHSTRGISNQVFLSAMTWVWSLREMSRTHEGVAKSQLEAGFFAFFSKNFWDGEEMLSEQETSPITPEMFNQVQ